MLTVGQAIGGTTVMDDESIHADVTLRVRGLRMRYGTTDVLQGVDFEARRGEVLALLGPNGAGKSTTIEILEGFRLRSAGEVEVLGVDPARADNLWRARIGIVLQSWRDHGKWQVRDLLAHMGDHYRDYSTEQRTRPRDVDELIEAVGLQAHAGKQISTLSGGQRRRLDVAIGLVGNPEVLFLDEPTTGFDPEARREFHNLIRGLTLSDTTVLLTTHDLDEAEKLAHRVVILVGGRIVADGAAVELARKIAALDEVSWTFEDRHHSEKTSDSTEFVRNLLTTHGGAITDLAIRKADLEDTYLALVRASAPEVEIEQTAEGSTR
ncbi:ABC transporter ATP-binding protein [Nocardia sp. KC 131]|uniref:ABC transporter ATP-binding protein n=1 Tax=Nocardia arseniciresistens TaxID=3392119 RepID=UPI00398F2B41